MVYHIVKSGLQILGTFDQKWYTVTDTQAVIRDGNVFCTEKWMDKKTCSKSQISKT